MPWQQKIADVALEVDEQGRLIYRDVGVTIPRQNGKTTLILAIELHRALMWKEQPQRISYSAQTGQEARRKLLEDQVPTLEASPLDLLKRYVRKAPGAEGIVFKTNSRISVMANTVTSGHGQTTDLGVIDEAFADLDNRREQAMRPAMMTRANSQIWWTSTAGTEESVYLKMKVQGGRAGVADGMTTGSCYWEWSAAPDDDPSDESVWWACMPALGKTISVETVRHDYKQAVAEDKIDEFRRAYLNVWTKSDERVIPAASWASVTGDDVTPEGRLVFGVDAPPDRSAASIVVTDEVGRCELIDHAEGIAWVVKRATDLAARHNAVIVMDSRGPLANLIDEMRAEGATVEAVTSMEMAQSAADLYDAVADCKISVRAPSDIDAAAAAATKRTIGDMWVWGRKDSRTDISPIVALTLSYGHQRRNTTRVAPWAMWG